MKNLIITEQGEELVAKLIAGEEDATFTKICTSDDDLSTVDLKKVTVIENIKQTSLIASVKKLDEATIELLAAVENTNLNEGYYIRTLGVYALDSKGNEILYAISIEDNPDYIPAFNGKNVSGISYTLNVRVDNSNNIVMEVNPAATPTIEQVQEITKDIGKIKQEIDTKITELENSIDTDIEILETQFSNALSLKADKSTILSGTLSIGETSITFTNDVLTEDSIIDIYTDVYGVSPKEVSSSIGSLTLTFDAQTVAVNIKVVVS